MAKKATKHFLGKLKSKLGKSTSIDLRHNSFPFCNNNLNSFDSIKKRKVVNRKS